MSYTDLLIHSCTVRRDVPGATTAYGYKTETFGDHLTSQACRLEAAKGREVKIGADIVIADYVLFMQDIDVTEQDKILLDSVTYEILLVELMDNGFGGHHKELLLRTNR